MKTLPIFPAQRSLWIAEQMGTAGAAMHAEQAVELDAPVDTGALCAAIQEIVRRHAALRTTFALADGEIWQQVHPDAVIPVPVINLDQAGSARQPEGYWLRHPQVRPIIDAPFDLAKDFPIRAGLVRLPAGRFGLLVVVHHIVSDLASAQILRSELTAVYAAFARGEPSPLPALRVPYEELMSRNRPAGSAADSSRLKRYWAQRLADLAAPIDLACGAPRPKVPSRQGAVLRTELTAAQVRKVTAFAQAEHVSVFAVALAAYYLTLAAHTGQRDLLVAVPNLQREDTASADHLGCFLNMLVLRESVVGAASLTEFLGNVWDTVIGALEHRELPFAEVVEIASPRRYPGYRPLTQVGFTVAEAESGALDFGPTSGKMLTIDREWIAYDLMASVQLAGESMLISFEYCPAVVPEATAATLLRNFTSILGRMCESTGLLVHDLTAGGADADHRAGAPATPVAASTDSGPDGQEVTGGPAALSKLASLWKEVLDGVEPAPEDDFFLLGGHSLAMINLMMRIDEVFAIELPLDDFLQLPTLREQAGLVARLAMAPAGDQEA